MKQCRTCSNGRWLAHVLLNCYELHELQSSNNQHCRSSAQHGQAGQGVGCLFLLCLSTDPHDEEHLHLATFHRLSSTKRLEGLTHATTCVKNWAILWMIFLTAKVVTWIFDVNTDCQQAMLRWLTFHSYLNIAGLEVCACKWTALKIVPCETITLFPTS